MAVSHGLSTIVEASRAEQNSRPLPETESVDSRWHGLYQLGVVVTVFQLICMLATIILLTAFGPEPKTAAETFAAFEANYGAGLARLDFPTLFIILLMPLSGFSVYTALREKHGLYATLALILAFTGGILALSNHSAISMIHLYRQYADAATEVGRAQLITAGEAIVASNMWNSTAGLVAGLCLQGGFVLFSLMMLRGKLFGRATAYTGLLANGLDWVHILVGLAAPEAGAVILAVGGMFYAVWYPLLARDFIRLARRSAAR